MCKQSHPAVRLYENCCKNLSNSQSPCGEDFPACNIYKSKLIRLEFTLRKNGERKPHLEILRSAIRFKSSIKKFVKDLVTSTNETNQSSSCLSRFLFLKVFLISQLKKSFISFHFSQVYIYFSNVILNPVTCHAG